MKKYIPLLIVLLALIPFAVRALTIFIVPQGGTGWGNFQSNTLLTGNGTSALSTTSVGTSLVLSNATLDINLAHSNWWTARQNFTNASTSQFTATSSIWFTGLTSGVIESDANGLLYREATSSVSSAGKIVVRDANLNAYAQNFVSAGTSFPTNGGTVTLTNASPRSWIFTGTNTETMKLPSGTTLTVGTTFTANNNSTLNVTIVDNGSNVLATVLPGGKTELVISDVSTTNGSWDAHALLGHGVTSGTNFLASTAASTTLFSNFGTAYFGGTSTTTISSTGAITAPTGVLNTFPNASTTNFTAGNSLGIPTGSNPQPTTAGYIAQSTNSPYQLQRGTGSATAIDDPTRFISFTYATSSPVGTTTIPIGIFPEAMTLNTIRCWQQGAGTTTELRFYYGPTPTSQYLNASSTANVNTWTSSNTPGSAATSSVDFGNWGANNVNYALTCTIAGTIIGI